MKLHPFTLAFILVITCAAILQSKDRSKRQPKTDQDQIEVVAHIPLADASVTRFLETRHYRREYLYAEHASEKAVTLIDVTKVEQPAVLADMPLPAGGAERLQAVTGDVALVATTNAGESTPSIAQTFRIMSFADPVHPAIKQVFENVTAIGRDDERGLIFLANRDGVWILRQHYAMDPEYVKEWEHMMLGAR